MASSPPSDRQDCFERIRSWAVVHAKYNQKLPGRARGAVRVLPNLYLGNTHSAADTATLANLKISAVCSVGPKSEKVAKGGGESELRPDIFSLKHESSIFRSVIQPCMWFLHDGTG